MNTVSKRSPWAALLAFLLALAALWLSVVRDSLTASAPVVPGQVLVKLKARDEALVRNWLQSSPYPMKAQIEQLGVYLLAVPPGSEADVAEKLSTDPLVAYAEPNYLLPYRVEVEKEDWLQPASLATYPSWALDPQLKDGGPPRGGPRPEPMPPSKTEPQGLPNDPLFFPYQWNLHNVGQTICYNSSSTTLICYTNITEDADIDAPEAWDVTTGDPFTIAVLSTGVDLTHPDLADKVLPGGYDFVNNDDDPSDDNWRGTFQAGIAAAIGNNGRDIAGVSWGARILPIKVLNSAGDGTWANLAEGVLYAADVGAHIIYIGTAGSTYSQVAADAIAYAQHKGALVIAPGHLPYPASFPGVIGVSATDFYDRHTRWTGTGEHIDVAAPGALIVSTVWRGADEDGRAVSSNTPAAAAHVAGLAALVWSVHPEYSAEQVAQAIFQSTDDLGEPGWDPEFGYGRINAYRAVTGAVTSPTPPPPAPTPTLTPVASPTATATPLPAGAVTVSIIPYSASVGWVRDGDLQPNHFGDDDMYTGVNNGLIYHGAVQFDLSRIPRNARVTAASVVLTGQGWIPPDHRGRGQWAVRLLGAEVDQGWSMLGFTELHNALPIATIGDPVDAGMLGTGVVNTFTFSESELRLLEDRLQTTRRISFRLDGPENGEPVNLFSWDSGYGAESLGRPPVLRVTYTLESATPTSTPPAAPTPTPTVCSGTTLQGCLGNNGRILGFVFFDRNGDRIRQPGAGEYGIPGATLVLRDADGNTVGTATTDAQGFYQFLGLRADVYVLEEINAPQFPGDTTPNVVYIRAEDFVFCCTVSVSFGDNRMATATPSPTPALPTPTPPSTPFPTPTPGGIGQQFGEGPGRRIQIPALDNLGDDETWVQVQNLGTRPTKVILFTWGDYSLSCPPQTPGPLKVECSGLLFPGAAWTFREGQLPSAARSAIAYSVPADAADDACFDAFDTVGLHSEWRAWENRWRQGLYGIGEPLGVSVNRRLTTGSGLPIASAYTGISEAMEGVYDPTFGGFTYYVPVLYNDADGWMSTLIIQNSGTECTSVEVWYRTQDDCLRAEIREVPVLAPGESVRLSPPALPAGRRGSAWIRASQPLGIVVDQQGNDMLLTYRGVPADSFGAGFSAGSLINYAPLIYREYNGWTSRIHVQNLSSTVNAKVKVYFLDEGGDIIQTVLDWICPRGSQTYELEAISNLPGRYVGAVRIESQSWWSPGDPPVDAPNIVAVVNLYNRFTGQGVSYNAFTQQDAQGARAVALPLLIRDNPAFGPAGTSWTSDIAVQNVNLNPGITHFRIDVYDQNGLVESFCNFVSERQVDYIDLANIATLPQGFSGSAVVEVTCSTQAGGGSIVAVGIERAEATGDFTKGFEGFRIDETEYNPPGVPPCPACP